MGSAAIRFPASMRSSVASIDVLFSPERGISNAKVAPPPCKFRRRRSWNWRAVQTQPSIVPQYTRALIHPRFWWEGLHVVGHRLQLHRPVVDAGIARRVVDPNHRVLQPVLVVAL